MKTVEWLAILCLVFLLMSAGLGFWVYRLREVLSQAQEREGEWLHRLKRARDARRLKIGAPAELAEFINQTTAFQAWWLETRQGVVTDDMVKTAPFWVDPHLASMALTSGQTVHQHQLTQSDWTLAYIPKLTNGTITGLLAVSSPKAVSASNLAFDELWSELVCAYW